MIRVGVTQRVAVVPNYAERRDCLDQEWARFLVACGLLPVLLPNIPDLALALCTGHQVSGLVLTGGNDLASLGGDAPERDATERALLDMAESLSVPVMGVCRGMQMLQDRCGVPLSRVEGHVTPRQVVLVDGRPREANSYHRFGARETRPPLVSWAVSGEGVVKAVRHATAPWIGIMWHPERTKPFSQSDIDLFRKVFRVKKCGL
jgi:N5-(cytidine 5'-diphosphoramidyl)-L-glutamine hydrolase